MKSADDALAHLAEVGAMTLSQLASAIAGAPIKGSWWSHPAGKQIYAIATALEASPDVVVAKLIDGKVTFLHRRYAPALIRVVTDPAWRAERAKGLLPGSRALLARIEKQGIVRFADKAQAHARKPLEARALVHAASEHTDGGHHGTVLTSWKRWAKGALAGASKPRSLAAAKTELAAIGLALVLIACGSDDEECPGRVCRGQIRDDDGRAVILRGMNVSTENKTAPYLGFHAEADLVRMRDEWGFDAVRWVMPWAAVEPAEGDYDDAYLDEVRTRLDWARDAGMLVVLDMHQDVYGEGFGFDGAPRWTCDEAHYADFEPQDPWPINYLEDGVIACFDALWTDAALGEKFAAAWRHVAAALADHPAVIGFDLLNEPHWGSHGVTDFEEELLQPFYARVIDEVRAEAPSWIAFVEPASSRNLGFPTSLLPFTQPDIVYAPHTYDATAEQGAGFDPTRRDGFIANIEDLHEEAERLGAALWIGEYGGLGADPGIAAYMDAAYDGAGAVAGGSMYWDYSRGGGYAPLDADGNEVASIVDAIVRPYPSRIAGDPISWTLDDDGALTVTWTSDAKITAPTEIIWPARLGAFDVTCDCTVSIDGDVVSLTATAAGVTSATISAR